MARVAALGAQSWQYVTDIASLEELFASDGPLTADDADRSCNDDPISIEMIDGLRIHVDRVMETIKARKESEVRTHIDQALRTATQRSAPDWDAESEQDEFFPVDVSVPHQEVTQAAEVMKETIVSLQAAQERMEIRARATAALQAAAHRAAASEAEDRNGGNKAHTSSQPAAQKNISQTTPKTTPAVHETSTATLQEKFQKAVEDAMTRQAAEALQQAQDQQKSPPDWLPMQDIMPGSAALPTGQNQQASAMEWQQSHLQPSSSPDWQQDPLHSASSFAHAPAHEAAVGYQVSHGHHANPSEWQPNSLQTLSSFAKPQGQGASQSVQVGGAYQTALPDPSQSTTEWQQRPENSTEWQQMQVLGGFQAAPGHSHQSGTLEWAPSFTHVPTKPVQTQAESIQERIKRVMAEAQIRSSKNTGILEAAEELTASGSSHSATDSAESSSDSGAEVPVRWAAAAAAPPPPGYWHPRPR